MRKAARKAAALEGAKREVARPPKTRRDESKYHKGSCAMRLVADPDRVGAAPGEWAALQPGDFWWGWEVQTIDGKEQRYRVLWAKYPDGCLASLPINMPPDVKEKGIRKASWRFDGNLERPTLTPSIHHIGHWHGYVRAGRMKSV